MYTSALSYITESNNVHFSSVYTSALSYITESNNAAGFMNPSSRIIHNIFVTSEYIRMRFKFINSFTNTTWFGRLVQTFAVPLVRNICANHILFYFCSDSFIFVSLSFCSCFSLKLSLLICSVHITSIIVPLLKRCLHVLPFPIQGSVKMCSV